jgi:ABC-2 type transport system ATP-binding protein
MIQTSDLGKSFGEFWAVKGVNLEVKPGQVLALLGQNGAGKTTTIRMLSSILVPTTGWARIAGYDVSKNPAQVRSSVGVLTEHHGLYLRMTGSEYLDFYGRVYGINPAYRKSRIQYLFEYFGLSDFYRQPIGQYSKGMRQKLALARSLLHEPPVLLLDEPTSAMDPESAQLVRKAIATLRSEERAIIICTHNLIEAELLADAFAIIYRGKILVSGSINDIKNELLGPPEFEMWVKQGFNHSSLVLPRGVTYAGKGEHGPRYRINHPERSNSILLKMFMEQGARVMAFQEIPRTLEQAYLAAMAKVKNV